MLAAPRVVERIGERAARDPWLSGFTGLLAQLLFVPVLVLSVVVLAVSIIGIPLLVLVPFAILGFLLAVLIGFTGVVLRLGRWAAGMDRPAFVTLAVGVVIVAAVGLLARTFGLIPAPLWPITWFLGVIGFFAEYVAVDRRPRRGAADALRHARPAAGHPGADRLSAADSSDERSVGGMKPPAVILLTAGVALLAHATLTALGMDVARVGRHRILGASGAVGARTVRRAFPPADRRRRDAASANPCGALGGSRLGSPRGSGTGGHLADPLLGLRQDADGDRLAQAPTTISRLWADPLLVRLDLAPLARLDDEARYYLHIGLVAGTLGEHAADDVNDAMFGKEEESGGIGALGRFLFRQAVALSEYFQSETTEITSRRLRGRELRTPLPTGAVNATRRGQAAMIPGWDPRASPVRSSSDRCRG